MYNQTDLIWYSPSCLRLFFRRTRYSSQGRKEEEGATRESWKTIPGLKVRQPPDLFLAGTNNDHLCSIKSNFVQSTETERTFGPSWNLLRARTPSLGSICSRIIECQTDIRKSLRTWVRDPIFFWSVMSSGGVAAAEVMPASATMVNLTDATNSSAESSGSSLEDYYAGEDNEFKVTLARDPRILNIRSCTCMFFLLFLQKKTTESSMCVFSTHPQERGRKAVDAYLDAYSYAGTYFYTTASAHFCLFTAWSCLLWTCKNNNMYYDGLFAFLPTHFTYCLTDLSF